jgi:hypothetical protein
VYSRSGEKQRVWQRVEHTYIHGNVTVTLSIAILNKPKWLLFKNGEQEGRTSPV